MLLQLSITYQVFCMSEDLYDNELLDYGGLEFPHIHYNRCNTKPYRYFYGCGFGHLVGDSLIKMDLESKKLKVSSYQLCNSELFRH